MIEPSAAAFDHAPAEHLAGDEHGSQVGIEDPVPFLQADLEEWRGAVDPRGVHENVRRPKLPLDVLPGSFDRVRRGRVDENGNRVAAGCLDRRNPAICALQGPAEDGDGGAGLGQPVADRATKHARASDYDRDLAVEPEQCAHRRPRAEPPGEATGRRLDMAIFAVCGGRCS